MCVSVRGYVLMNAQARGGQGRVLEPLDLELQAVGSHLTWVLGVKPSSSGRVASIPLLSHLSSPDVPKTLSHLPPGVVDCTPAFEHIRQELSY